MSNTNQRVALLYGGASAERDISLQSGAAVEAALRSRGDDVTPIDPRNVDLRNVDWSPFDVAFIALHGTFGEDGGVQRILETAGLPFTGSSSGASRLAFNKSAAKERFFQFDVASPNAMLVGENDSPARIDQCLRSVGFPLVVKPNSQGSSLGVSIVRDATDLPVAMTAGLQYDRFCLLEEFVPGEEWTVALIDRDVLPPIRIEPTAKFFDYDAKYESEETRYCVNPDMSRELRTRIASAALRACAAIGTSGAVRVDMIVDSTGRPQVLEVNTVPGLTSHSLLPMAAREAGLSFEELCERMVARAERGVASRAA